MMAQGTPEVRDGGCTKLYRNKTILTDLGRIFANKTDKENGNIGPDVSRTVVMMIKAEKLKSKLNSS